MRGKKRYINCNRKSDGKVYISRSASLGTSSSHVLSTGEQSVFLRNIGKHVRDGLQPSFPREAIGSRIERRRTSGIGRGGGDRGGGHMQQVVRFSKPIEIDGFPIPWQTLSPANRCRFVLADELTIHRSFYRYCSDMEGERAPECESGTRAESR